MLLLLLLALATPVIEDARLIQGLLAADLNDDGWPDLITQNAQGYRVYLNRKALRFELIQSIEKIGIGEPGGATLADINSDGYLDLVSGSHDSYRIAILLGNGKGTFTPAANSPLIPRTHGKPHNHRLAVADLNGDHYPDIASANIQDGDLTLLWGDGKGNFRPAANSPFPLAEGIYDIHIADINHDQIPDLVGASTAPTGPQLAVALGTGKGQFTTLAATPATHKWRTANLQLTDWNQDGHLDAIVGPGERDRPMLLLGNGKGQFQQADLGWAASGRTWGFIVSGRHLIVAADHQLEIFSSKGIQKIPVRRDTWGMAVGDFDHDGKPDIASFSAAEKSVEINPLP
jgi:hypothetical protein